MKKKIQRNSRPVLAPLVSIAYIGCVKLGKNSIFLQMGKTVISVENSKFSRSRMKKQTSLLNSSPEI